MPTGAHCPRIKIAVIASGPVGYIAILPAGFSRVLATLHLALSVGRSVGQALKEIKEIKKLCHF